MTRRAPSRPTRGFTLVEVLVALMVMSILAVMSWQGIDGIARTRAVSQERLEQTLRLNTVLGQLEHDLQALQESPATPGLAFDGATLRITRRAETGLQVVTWSLRPDADGQGSSWLRWAGPPARTTGDLQETWFRTQQFQGSEPGQLRTLAGISQWQVYCYRGNSWSNCQSTGNIVSTVVQAPAAPAAGASGSATAPDASASAVAATPVLRQQLPSGVRVVLTFDGRGLGGTLTRDIALGP